MCGRASMVHVNRNHGANRLHLHSSQGMPFSDRAQLCPNHAVSFARVRSAGKVLAAVLNGKGCSGCKQNGKVPLCTRLFVTSPVLASCCPTVSFN